MLSLLRIGSLCIFFVPYEVTYDCLTVIWYDRSLVIVIIPAARSDSHWLIARFSRDIPRTTFTLTKSLDLILIWESSIIGGILLADSWGLFWSSSSLSFTSQRVIGASLRRCATPLSTSHRLLNRDWLDESIVLGCIFGESWVLPFLSAAGSLMSWSQATSQSRLFHSYGSKWLMSQWHFLLP